MKKLLLAASVASIALSGNVFADQAVSGMPEIESSKLVFLSPHPDDILLTFGGFIDNMKKANAMKGKDSVTQVYFSLSNYTTNHLNELTDKRVTDVGNMRHSEDFGAHIDMFEGWQNFRYSPNGFYDAPLRHYEGSKTAGGGPAGSFADFRDSEIEAYNQISEEMKAMLTQEDCSAFALIANGTHIDHFVTREAVLKAMYELGDKATCDVYFGLDQPYTGSNPKMAMVEINKLKERLPKGAITSYTYKIDKDKKIADFKHHYLSQYDIGYIAPLENSPTETLFKVDRSAFSKIKAHQECKQDFCTLAE